jgi:hypothetical protein
MSFLNRTGTMRSIARAAFGCPLLLTESIWEHSRPVEKRWLPRECGIQRPMDVHTVAQRFTNTNRYG